MHEHETQRVHKQAWGQFYEWCLQNGHKSPVSCDVVAAWMYALADGTDQPGAKPRAVSTILTYVQAIAAAHRIRGRPFESNHPALREARARIRSQSARRPQRVVAVTRADVVDILTMLNNSPGHQTEPTVQDLRDGAIFALAWSAALRLDELINLRWIDVGNGTCCVVWRHLQSRGKQPRVLFGHDGDLVETVPCTNLGTRHFQVLKDWVREANIWGRLDFVPSDRPVGKYWLQRAV